MNTLRWRAILWGAAAFLVAHYVERALWTSWFVDNTSMIPWFTNSGRAVIVTVVCIFVAEILSGTPQRDRGELMLGAANVSGGGIVTMIVALFATGAGTIAPLVIIIGGALVIAGAFAGTLMVRALSMFSGQR